LADEEFPREDELESRQGAALYPVGRVLRSTYDAENHDSLGNDLTGLMLELAHIDPDGGSLPRPALPPLAAAPVPPEPMVEHSPAPPPVAAAPPRSWWRTALDRLLAG
jgi:hypothetical protein